MITRIYPILVDTAPWAMTVFSFVFIGWFLV